MKAAKRKGWRIVQRFLCVTIVLTFIGCNDNRTGEVTALDGGLYRIEVFNTAFNFMGMQGGWWGGIVRDKFNLELNIIAPQGVGDTMFQTRSAAGNLGDLIIARRGQIQDLQRAGLLMDLRPLLPSAPNVRQKLSVAYEEFAKIFPGDGIWALPGRVSARSPMEPAGRGFDPEAAVFIRFDWYLKIGAPEIAGKDGLLDVLYQMVRAHPVNERGDRTFAFSLFPDWDGLTVRAAREMMKILDGFHDGSGTSFIWMNADGTETTYLLEDNSLYHQYLRWLNRAFRMGILDPDSATQNWDTARAKFRDGRIAFGFWPFIADSIFAHVDFSNRSPYAVVPVTGGTVINMGYNPYGLDVFAYAIGSNARYPERIMEFIDWLCSPEGVLLFNNLVRGVTFELDDNGAPYPTEFGLDPNPNKMAPEHLGGGSWFAGGQQIMLPLIHPDDPNELLNGYPVNPVFWPSVIEAISQNEWVPQWREMFQADNPLEMLKNRDMLQVRPGTEWHAPVVPSEISFKMNQIGRVVQPAGWRMIFARSDAEFDRIWREMRAQLNDLGYQEVLAFERENIRNHAAAIQRVMREFGD